MPKLTDRFLAALSVDKDRKDRLVFDIVSPGLGVRVTAKGTRTFIVQVHLSRPAQAVLRALSEARSKDSKGGKGEICNFVFSTTGKTSISGFSRAKARLDATIAETRAKAAAAAATESAPLVPWRLHDVRRTGASTLARLGFDTIAIDKLLAHQPTKLRGVAAIYQRYDFADERARALDAWAEHVLTSNPGERERPLDNAMLVVVGAGRRSIRSRP